MIRRNEKPEVMSGLTPWEYQLDATQRRDGLVTGNARRLYRRLSRGHPITVVAVGASVAVQGGCTSQEEAECMKYGGGIPTDLGWGRVGRFKGFLVRWLDWVNSTWPHPGHRLVNRASGGTALQTVLPCLFGTLPPRVDLVVLEVGSMAKFLTLSAIELAVRKFLSLPVVPSLLFVNVPLWYRPEFVRHQDKTTLEACQSRFSQNDFRMPSGAGGSHDRPTPWSRAERESERVCLHYSQSCLSLYRALAPAILEGRPRFGMAEVARDCVHPMHGTHGTAYVTDLMVHWLQTGGTADEHHPGGGGANHLTGGANHLTGGANQLTGGANHLTGGANHLSGGANHLSGGGGRSSAMGGLWPRLPRPLHGKAVVRQARQTTACYFLHADGRREQPEGETTWLVHMHIRIHAHVHRSESGPRARRRGY